MIESVVKVFLLIGLGYFLVILGLREKIGSKISKVVFLFARSKLEAKHLNIVLVVIIYILLSLILISFAVKRLKLSREIEVSTIVSSVFLNSAFLPIPLAYSLYSNVLPVIVVARAQ